MNTTKYAELYARTYDNLFGRLSKPLQDRVLACKADNKLVDIEVDQFVALVIERAEQKENELEAREVQALKDANAQLQLNEVKGTA